MAKLTPDWGPQALWDLSLLRALLGHVSHVVPEVLLPRLCALSDDEAAVRARFLTVSRSLPEPSSLASPRARWRYEYGRFVREVEWVTAELSRHMSEAQLERLVVDEMARGIEAWAQPLQAGFQRLLTQVAGGDGGHARLVERAEAELGPRVGRLLFRSFNVASFLVGPVEVTDFDASRGRLQLRISECAFHTVAQDGKAQTRGCLWVCKGACERVFDETSGLELKLEPELPALSCVMSLTWKERGT